MDNLIGVVLIGHHLYQGFQILNEILGKLYNYYYFVNVGKSDIPNLRTKLQEA